MSAPPDFLPSYPTDFDTAPNDGEPGQFSSGDPQEGSASRDVEGTASDQLLYAFEMVENPCSSVISLSSTDSLHQTAPPAHSEGVCVCARVRVYTYAIVIPNHVYVCVHHTML